MKKAISYLRGQRVFTHASSKTTAGVWILELPVFVADATDVGALGQQVTQALRASKEGVPHPVSWKGIFDPVLELAGVKSWATFVKSARCVGIESVSEEVSFISTENLGASGGFNDIDRSADPVAIFDTLALGHGLMAAFEKAK